MSRTGAGVAAYAPARRSLQHSASAGVLAFVLLASALLPIAVHAQTSQTAPPAPSPPSAESLQQMRQELEALRRGGPSQGRRAGPGPAHRRVG